MRRYWRWLAIAVVVLVGVWIMVSVVNKKFFAEVPTQENVKENATEQAAPATAEEFVASVNTVGTSGGLLVAHVNAPSAGSLHWENAQGMVASDTITWEQPMVGDIEMSPTGDTTGLVPVLTTSQGVVKGNPLP